MTQHTPGPWYIMSEDASFGDIPFIDVSRGESGTPSCKAICEVQSTLDDDNDFVLTPEDWANARLIAAAPELLAALKDLMCFETDSYCEWCEGHAPKDDSGKIIGPIPHKEGCAGVAARAAIARAEGEGQ